MAETKFDLIEYRGFKDVFFGLGCNEGKYYVLYGKIGKPSMDIEDDSLDIYYHFQKISKYVTDRYCTLKLPFISNKNGINFCIININDRSEYDTMIKIFEALL